MRRYAIAIAMMFLLMIAIIWVVFNLALSVEATPQQDKNCPSHPLDPRCIGWDPSPTTSSTTQPVTTTTSSGETTTTTLPGTTTTQDGSTTTEPLPSLSMVGVTGCSNTKLAVDGYQDLSSLDLLLNTARSGATVLDWATNSGRTWGLYEKNRPYDAAWINLCERSPNNLTNENLQAILDHIWSLDPGIPVFISPLNYYEEGVICTMTGTNSVPEAGAILADQFAADYDLVFRGPDLGPLDLSELRADNCHPNDDGVAELGAQLEEFFDE